MYDSKINMSLSAMDLSQQQTECWSLSIIMIRKLINCVSISFIILNISFFSFLIKLLFSLQISIPNSTCYCIWIFNCILIVFSFNFSRALDIEGHVFPTVRVCGLSSLSFTTELSKGLLLMILITSLDCYKN